MAFQDKKFLDAEGITHLVRLLDEYPNNQVLGSVIDAIEGELEQKAEKSEIPDVPVQDVQVNGVSVLSDGVANVPVASTKHLGVVQVAAPAFGISINANGQPSINCVNVSEIKNYTGNAYRPLPSGYLKEAIFYGMAHAAGDTTQKQSSNAVGTYTDSAKSAIQSMLGITQMLAPENPNLVATQGYAIGDVFAANGHLYKATAAIAQDEAIIPDTNCVETTMAEAGGKIKDVQVNGTSIVQDGVANVPVASSSTPGVMRINTSRGFEMDGDALTFKNASDAQLKAGTNQYRPITPSTQYAAAFYGLAKAAGDTTQSASNNAVGTYTNEAKSAIQTMLDVPSNSDVTNAIGSAIGNIHQFEVQVVQTLPAENIQEHTVYFVPKTGETNDVYDEYIYVNNTWEMIGNTQIDLSGYVQSSELADVATSGDYDDLTNKPTIPEVPVQDVQVNGTSVLSNGVANIPIADRTVMGVGKVADDYGIQRGSGGLSDYLVTAPAASALIKSGDSSNQGTYKPITPRYQHESVFYGLAKVSGVDEKNSTLSVGTYTETAKSAIRNMLGAASTNIVAVQDEQPTDTDTKVWLPGTQAAGVQVPTMEDMQNYVQKTDYATDTTSGVVKVLANNGIDIATTGALYIKAATDTQIKQGIHAYKPIIPSTQHASVFYGLAKAAGDATQSASDNAVGTYTDGAKTAIRSMLGAIGDVQANGTSVVSDGIANLPYATTSRFGVTKIGSGLQQGSDGSVMAQSASTSQIKAGLSLYNAIMPGIQHQSVFYGLAKLAGVDMASSSNAIGTYTTEAKSAIQQMLGIDLQSIASEVEIPLVETISGTTPSITGQPNTRYVCGEVSTLSITPPSAGSIDVIFDSGSTPAVITVPNTVRWPAWFDATALEADTTYEILITDGVYGSVMTWAN